MNQDSLFGFFELSGCQFFFQEVHLLVTQPGKVVQTIIQMCIRDRNEELRLWDVLVDPARKIRIGNKLYFGDDDSMVRCV